MNPFNTKKSFKNKHPLSVKNIFAVIATLFLLILFRNGIYAPIENILYGKPDYAKNIEVVTYILTDEQAALFFKSDKPQSTLQLTNFELEKASEEDHILYLALCFRNTGDLSVKATLDCDVNAYPTKRLNVFLPPDKEQFKIYASLLPPGRLHSWKSGIVKETEKPLFENTWNRIIVK